MNRLREARVDKDLSQEQLAQRAGVSVMTVIRAEKGRTISPLSQARLAKALGVPRAELFPGS